MHAATSKQLFFLALYLAAAREEIGLSAGNFLTAVAHQRRGSTRDSAAVRDCGGRDRAARPT